MIIHDTVYNWDGKSRQGEQPICWWPGSYYIRIVDLSSGKTDITHLKPLAVLCKNRGSGTSIRKCIQNFAKRVSSDFDFDLEKALWIEIDKQDNTDIHVANLQFQREVGGERLYAATWRKAMPNEIALIQPFITDFGKSKKQ